MTIYVPVGLPGAGKTSLYHDSYDECIYIDGDSFSSLKELVAYVRTLPRTSGYYLDGLFVTESSQNFLKEYLPSDPRFIYFPPDLEACLYNDALRGRNLSAAAVIRNAKVHNPHSNFNVTTIRFTPNMKILKFFGFTSPKYESHTWSTGGTYGTCWDEDGPSVVCPDEPLALFLVLKSLLPLFQALDICPDNLDTLYPAYVTLVEDSEADYYGGVEEFASWHIDLEGLLDQLQLDHNISDFESDYPEIFL